jgi:hypothetical protein
MALLGAEARQLLRYIEEVEAEIGQTAIGVAQDVGEMMVHPKLIERLRKPDGDFFETALPFAFPTPDFSRCPQMTVRAVAPRANDSAVMSATRPR